MLTLAILSGEERIINALLENPYLKDPDKPDGNGNTPLLILLQHKTIPTKTKNILTEKFLLLDVDPHHSNNEGLTPCQHAKNVRYLKILKMMENQQKRIALDTLAQKLEWDIMNHLPL